MNWINKQWHKVWLYLITLANNYLVGRNKEDAEQVTEPAPTPPVEKPTKPEPIDTRLANTLLVLDAGHYKETAGKRGPKFKPEGQAIEWVDNRVFVQSLYACIQIQNKKIQNPIIDVVVANKDWLKEEERFDLNFDASAYHNSKGRENLYYRNTRINDIYKANVNKYKRIIFISIHHNAVNNPNVRGLELYYHGVGNNHLSKIFCNTIWKWFRIAGYQGRYTNTTHKDVTVRPDTWIYSKAKGDSVNGFSILRNNKQYSTRILIEVEYMTNREAVVDILNTKLVNEKTKVLYNAIKEFIKE